MGLKPSVKDSSSQTIHSHFAQHKNKKLGRRSPQLKSQREESYCSVLPPVCLTKKVRAAPLGLVVFLSSGYTIRASPLSPISGAKYSARLRVPEAQASPWLQMGPTCMMVVTAVWVMVGIAAVALRDCGWNTCHCAVALLALLSLVPQNAIFTCPGPAAVTPGPMAV